MTHRRNATTRPSDVGRTDEGDTVEWIVAVVSMFLVSAVVVGLPVLAVTMFWDSRRRPRP